MFFLILYLCFMLIRPQDWLEPFIGLPTAIIFVPLGLLIGYFAQARSDTKITVPQSFIILCYLADVFLCTFVNEGFGVAKDQTLIYVQRCMVFFMVLWCIQDKKHLKTIITAFVIFTLFIAIQAIIQMTTGEAIGGLKPYQAKEVQRAIWWGSWDGPNVVAILFLLGVCITMEWVLGAAKLTTRIFALIAIVIYLAGIYYTNSRGAMLALVFVLIYRFRARLYHPKIIVGAVILVTALIAVAPSRVTQISSSESSAHERTWLWEQGLAMYRNNPIFGVGRGQFARNTDLKLLAHNNYVQNFAEMGSIGYFLFMALLWLCYKGNWLAIKHENEIDVDLVRINRMMINILAGYCAITFFVVMEHDIFYLLLGISASAYLLACKQSKVIPHPEFTRRDVGIVVLAMIFVVFLIWLAAVKHII